MKEQIRSVKVRGASMEVWEMGEGPPVIILTGMNSPIWEWHAVVHALSVQHRVILFHRPGLGKSELGEAIRRTGALTEELAELLPLLSVHEPVVLIGHSYGGLCAQHFARSYPLMIKALLLVDSTSVNLHRLDALMLPVMDADDDAAWLETCRIYSEKTSEELMDLIAPGCVPGLPTLLNEKLQDFQWNPVMYAAMYSEVTWWKEDAMIMKNGPGFPQIPLTVIARDKEYVIRQEDGLPEWEKRIFETLWEKLMYEQSELTDDSRFIIAEESGHAVHLDRPDVVVEAFHHLAEKVQGNEGAG
ncbi:alpha/beta hydrolase [Rossellomorea marisflavi]|uniref:alpha/beta fold hydrolase n=1 Tax=Rossellomorea marisflavi TaxID=189381 RepID=UPI0027A9A78B|nr:alpha/beta hydrolase [Rossellomorea marisflavi]UTE70870.1 alpha/beta hydrolase [Rossellomorea marisflavi]